MQRCEHIMLSRYNKPYFPETFYGCDVTYSIEKAYESILGKVMKHRMQ